MTLNIIAVVLSAALLHATWNFFVKRSTDTFQGMASVVLGRGLFGVGALYFSPEISIKLLLYIAAAVLLHLGYQVFLLNSYRLGDLTQVYPMARGSSPLIIALVSIAIGVRYTPAQLWALALIGAGLMGIAIARIYENTELGYKSALFACATGGFIAAYSLIDGLGAREAGTALGYYAIVTTINAVVFGAMTRIVRPGLLGKIFSIHLGQTIMAGCASFTAYVLVIWAFTKAPIALVASLRETSILFALVMGAVFLQERVTLFKLMATLLAMAGIVFLRLESS